jgi:hypothetical protein
MSDRYLLTMSLKGLAAIVLVLLALAACSPETVSQPPPVVPRTGPSWTPQEAIGAIENTPLAAGELSWNAEFDPYLGRWQVTLIYNIRRMYPPRDERQSLLWYVYEDTGEVEGPFQ